MEKWLPPANMFCRPQPWRETEGWREKGPVQLAHCGCGRNRVVGVAVALMLRAKALAAAVRALRQHRVV